MKKLLALAILVLFPVEAMVAPTCPDDFYYNCWPYKKSAGPWFSCCMTPDPQTYEYCCEAECRQISCVTGWFDCPLLEGDGIERNYISLHGPDYLCSNNFCFEVE